MAGKPSLARFKPHFQSLGFRSPHWNITNYFAKIRLQINARFSGQRPAPAPPWNQLRKSKVK